MAGPDTPLCEVPTPDELLRSDTVPAGRFGAKRGPAFPSRIPAGLSKSLGWEENPLPAAFGEPQEWGSKSNPYASQLY